MRCRAIAFSLLLSLAATTAGAGATSPTPVVATAPHSVASEPLFVDIVARAGALKAQAEGWKTADLTGALGQTPGFAAFKDRLSQLAALDMQGHVLLAGRGTDGDLKCILKGISQDLPVKLKDIEDASTPKARLQAINELSYLLRDNVEVITSPPAPPA